MVLKRMFFPLRYFAEQGHNMLVSVSHSKSFGLYGERIGALFILAKDADQAKKIGQVIRQIIRVDYSNPPRHGALVIDHILGTDDLKKKWRDELDKCRGRISEIRQAFINATKDAHLNVDYSYLEDSKGMFMYTGLTKPQVSKLLDEHGVYMTSSGRINVTGLNHDNMDYVVKAISKVL